MSYPPCQNGGLRQYEEYRALHLEPRLIAAFGGAKIVRIDPMIRTLEIHGGTPEKIARAQAWATTFLQPGPLRTVWARPDEPYRPTTRPPA